MTLVWLAATLTVIVFGCLFATWTVRVHTLKCGRLVELHRQRMHADIAGDGDDQRSRAAWATSRHLEYQRAMTITLSRANEQAFDRLNDLLAPRTRLEVVA